MGRTFTVYCDDDLAKEVVSLSRTFGVSENEVARQLVEIGLAEVDRTDNE